MVQEIILGLIFIAALFYLGRMIYRNVKRETECQGNGCPKCAPKETHREKA